MTFRIIRRFGVGQPLPAEIERDDNKETTTLSDKGTPYLVVFIKALLDLVLLLGT